MVSRESKRKRDPFWGYPNLETHPRTAMSANFEVLDLQSVPLSGSAFIRVKACTLFQLGIPNREQRGAY